VEYRIVEVTNNRLLREFINLPYKLYKDDPNWVPLVKLLTRQTVRGKDNALFSNGEHITYILKKGKDGTLSGPLDVIAIDGVTNAYGFNLKVNSGFQIKGY